MLETTALLQYRFEIEALRLLESDILPIVEIIWVDEAIHNRGLDVVFTFDPYFRRQGFTILPTSSATP